MRRFLSNANIKLAKSIRLFDIALANIIASVIKDPSLIERIRQIATDDILQAIFSQQFAWEYGIVRAIRDPPIEHLKRIVAIHETSVAVVELGLFCDITHAYDIIDMSSRSSYNGYFQDLNDIGITTDGQCIVAWRDYTCAYVLRRENFGIEHRFLDGFTGMVTVSGAYVLATTDDKLLVQKFDGDWNIVACIETKSIGKVAESLIGYPKVMGYDIFNIRWCTNTGYDLDDRWNETGINGLCKGHWFTTFMSLNSDWSRISGNDWFDFALQPSQRLLIVPQYEDRSQNFYVIDWFGHIHHKITAGWGDSVTWPIDSTIVIYGFDVRVINVANYSERSLPFHRISHVLATGEYIIAKPSNISRECRRYLYWMSSDITKCINEVDQVEHLFGPYFVFTGSVRSLQSSICGGDDQLIQPDTDIAKSIAELTSGSYILLLNMESCWMHVQSYDSDDYTILRSPPYLIFGKRYVFDGRKYCEGFSQAIPVADLEADSYRS